MPGADDGPHRHDDTTRTRWPWESPFAWVFPPSRQPGFIARLLARLRPPAGNHHAQPQAPEPPVVPPPRQDRDDSVPAGMMTQLDLKPLRARPYVPTPREGNAP